MGIDIGDRNLAIGLINCDTNQGYVRWADMNVDNEGYVLVYEDKHVIHVMNQVIEENKDWFSIANMIGVELNRGSRQKCIAHYLKGILSGKGYTVCDVSPVSVRGIKKGFGHTGPTKYSDRKKASLSVPLLNDNDLNKIRICNNQGTPIEKLNKRKSEKTDMIEALTIAAYVRKNYHTLLLSSKRKRKCKVVNKEKVFDKVKKDYKTRLAQGPFKLLKLS